MALGRSGAIEVIKSVLIVGTPMCWNPRGTVPRSVKAGDERRFMFTNQLSRS